MPKIKAPKGARNEQARAFLAESAPKVPAAPPSPAPSVLTQPPPAKEERKPLDVQLSKAAHLLHDDGRTYDFHRMPDDEVTVILQLKGILRRAYTMPTPEAKYLWNRLRGQGFQPW